MGDLRRQQGWRLQGAGKGLNEDGWHALGSRKKSAARVGPWPGKVEFPKAWRYSCSQNSSAVAGQVPEVGRQVLEAGRVAFSMGFGGECHGPESPGH